jgi:hypothetical protein
MDVLMDTAGTDIYSVMLALLNVIQTVALAYLAARSHVDHAASAPPRQQP